MTTKLSLRVKQAGGMAYVRCFNRSAYDVLMDDQLFDDLAELWDCPTLEALRAFVAETGNRSSAQAYLRAISETISPPSL